MEIIQTKQWLIKRILIIENLVNHSEEQLEKNIQFDDDMQKFTELLIHIHIINVPRKTISRFKKEVIFSGKSLITEKDLKKYIFQKIFFVFLKNIRNKNINIRSLIQQKLDFNIMEIDNSPLNYKMFNKFFSIFDTNDKEVAKIVMENGKYRAIYYLENENSESIFDNFYSAFKFIDKIYKNLQNGK